MSDQTPTTDPRPVCPNCGQWQHASTGDCLNECVRRGFAPARTPAPPATDTARELVGHTSPDTAYIVDDYPYGFRLRTQIRYWIETKAGHGQRVMSQTRNPKKAGQPWNAPKGSTYIAIRALYLDTATGHVVNDGIGGYSSEAEIRTFMARFPLTCADERNRKALDYLIASARAQKRITWTVTTNPNPDEPRQTAEEQAAILRKLTALELSTLRTEQAE